MALKTRSEAVKKRLPRILAHPFEFAVALMFLIAAGGAGKAIIDYGNHLPNEGLMSLPHSILWAWIAIIALGGILILAGIGANFTNAMSRAVERGGLWLSGAAWASVAVGQAVFTWSDPLTYGQYLAICLGVGLRLWASRKVEKAMERVDGGSRDG